MTGGKSNQNIGLFRCMGGEESEKAVAEYWEYEKRLPYFAVGFLKIREPQKYREVGLNLEAAFNVGADDAGRLCVALTYITFDNADLVILIKGNSMTRMCGLMEATERREEVLYAHFIPGVEEGYLEACKDQGRVLDDWAGTFCFTGEKIARIELQMATSGNRGIWQALKEAWDKSDKRYSIKGYDNITYSYIAGHCNLYMAFDRHGCEVPSGFAAARWGDHTSKRHIWARPVQYRDDVSDKRKFLEGSPGWRAGRKRRKTDQEEMVSDADTAL